MMCALMLCVLVTRNAWSAALHAIDSMSFQVGSDIVAICDDTAGLSLGLLCEEVQSVTSMVLCLLIEEGLA